MNKKKNSITERWRETVGNEVNEFHSQSSTRFNHQRAPALTNNGRANEVRNQ